MTGEPGGLAATVRRKLDEGQPADVVIQELVARGLSKATAERFVNRALEERISPPSWTPTEPIPSLRPSTESPSLTDYLRNHRGIAEQQAYNDLTRGAVAMASGLALTAFSFASSGRARLMYGLIVFGLVVLGRGVARCGRLDRPFPWKRVLASVAIPGAVIAIVFAYIGWRVVAQERQLQAAAVAELAAADQSRAAQNRAESAVQRDSANQARTERQEARLAEALTQLNSTHPMTQCDAALLLGRIGSKEHVPPLVSLLSAGKSPVCAAGALVDLGEIDTAMAAYLEWAEGDDPDLYRAALGGFGDIGPSAADAALPHLAKALTSPHMSLRYLAADSLSKLGPAAVPLLQIASGDADKLVREAAVRALAGKR